MQRSDNQLLYGQSSIHCWENFVLLAIPRLTASSHRNAQCTSLYAFFKVIIKREPNISEPGSHDLHKKCTLRLLNSWILWYSLGDLATASARDRMSYFAHADSSTLSRKQFHLFLVGWIFYYFNSLNYLPKGQTTITASTWKKWEWLVEVRMRPSLRKAAWTQWHCKSVWPDSSWAFESWHFCIQQPPQAQ